MFFLPFQTFLFYNFFSFVFNNNIFYRGNMVLYYTVRIVYIYIYTYNYKFQYKLYNTTRMACTTLTVYAFRPLVREYSAGPKTIVNMCVYSRCILALTLTHYRRYSIIYLCTLRPRSTCVYSTARVIINVKTHRTIVFSKCIYAVILWRGRYKEKHII